MRRVRRRRMRLFAVTRRHRRLLRLADGGAPGGRRTRQLAVRNFQRAGAGVACSSASSRASAGGAASTSRFSSCGDKDVVTGAAIPDGSHATRPQSVPDA
jgi:hypothetical protein